MLQLRCTVMHAGKLPDMLYCDLVTLVVIVCVAESYCNLSPGMQCLEQQGLSILLHIAEGLGLHFELLPEGGACLLFLLHSFVHGVLQACICELSVKATKYLPHKPACMGDDALLASYMQGLLCPVQIQSLSAYRQTTS